ncbi:MAG: hypothetical protein A3F41_01755 [Coxiella sp. RIFCSPHIGHO2_12_FULL_44_14]|nr:MAG: hypothetical protein A3F41_01755 [Coxiella sp. RIFCSPHIGHO2_12_FULL_44_14]
MMTLALHTLETALNAYLELDPATLGRLSHLQGKTIQFVIEDWRLEFFIIPSAMGIELHSKIDSQPSTVVTGRLNALLRTALAKGSNTALFENQIRIEGDLHTGETIRAILSNIDIDWEEQLSKMVGDIAAHKIGSAANRLKSAFTTGCNTLEKNLKEFLHMELRALPTPDEVNHFFNEVTHLRHAVERLEARMHRFETERKAH